MADNKGIDGKKTSVLNRERRRLRITQIAFGVFCVVLILSLMVTLYLTR